jgi:predicted nucleotidyltransferase
MRRDEATRLIESVLAAVTAADRTDAVHLVTAIDVFGSYARGALDPRDVDLNVEYDRQAALELFDVYEWMEGKATRAIKTGLAGRTRKIQMQFEMRLSSEGYRGATLVPLWRAGDDLATAVDRLRATVTGGSVSLRRFGDR